MGLHEAMGAGSASEDLGAHQDSIMDLLLLLSLRPPIGPIFHQSRSQAPASLQTVRPLAVVIALLPEVQEGFPHCKYANTFDCFNKSCVQSSGLL